VRIAFLVLLLSTTSLFGAATIRLVNDSPYMLKAVVRGHNGMFLGEMVINSQDAFTWRSGNTEMGYYGEGNVYQEHPNSPEIPYTVLWFCPDGSDFSVCDAIAPGSTATALGCPGTRECGQEIKKYPPSSPSGRQGFLPNEQQREQESVGAPSY
jgi:hypothetical protein